MRGGAEGEGGGHTEGHQRNGESHTETLKGKRNGDGKRGKKREGTDAEEIHQEV